MDGGLGRIAALVAELKTAPAVLDKIIFQVVRRVVIYSQIRVLRAAMPEGDPFQCDVGTILHQHQHGDHRHERLERGGFFAFPRQIIDIVFGVVKVKLARFQQCFPHILPEITVALPAPGEIKTAAGESETHFPILFQDRRRHEAVRPLLDHHCFDPRLIVPALVEVFLMNVETIPIDHQCILRSGLRIFLVRLHVLHFRIGGGERQNIFETESAGHIFGERSADRILPVDHHGAQESIRHGFFRNGGAEGFFAIDFDLFPAGQFAAAVKDDFRSVLRLHRNRNGEIAPQFEGLFQRVTAACAQNGYRIFEFTGIAAFFQFVKRLFKGMELAFCARRGDLDFSSHKKSFVFLFLLLCARQREYSPFQGDFNRW